MVSQNLQAQPSPPDKKPPPLLLRLVILACEPLWIFPIASDLLLVNLGFATLFLLAYFDQKWIVMPVIEFMYSQVRKD